MALNFDKYAIVSIDSITGFDIATKECIFILDEIKDATLEGAAETIWSTGKEGRRLSAMKRNKTCSISANNGFIVGGLLAQQFVEVLQGRHGRGVGVLHHVPIDQPGTSVDDGALHGL